MHAVMMPLFSTETDMILKGSDTQAYGETAPGQATATPVRATE